MSSNNHSRLRFALLLLLVCGWAGVFAQPQTSGIPVPVLEPGKPVNWWFVFKLNSTGYPGCNEQAADQRVCLFDSNRAPVNYSRSFGLQYLFASSAEPTLKKGATCLGDTIGDPLGATFSEIYNGPYYYVVWNDQTYAHPPLRGCGHACGAGWGHSKGIVAWNEAGEGVVIQVTTPSWPGAGSKDFPRSQDGNTLGCVQNNNLGRSQHFFALRLNKADLISVLAALQNASAPTDLPRELNGKPPKGDYRSLVRNGGPELVQALVNTLHTQVPSKTASMTSLSSGVILISKPADLNVPPWQMVSSMLGGISLKVATFWNPSDIPNTKSGKKPTCWPTGANAPGAVVNSATGHWHGETFDLKSAHNHAKLGVSTSGAHTYAIFADMNQQGALGPKSKCARSQNGRGGLFFVVDDKKLHDEVESLISANQSAP